MRLLGVSISHVEPGEAHLAVDATPDLLQHDGYFHAGVTVTMCDTAAGLSALTLFDAGAGVLSAEFKVNLMRPALAAPGSTLVARGRVLKPGRLLTVCASDAFVRPPGGSLSDEVHVATLLLTMVATDGVKL